MCYIYVIEHKSKCNFHETDAFAFFITDLF